MKNLYIVISKHFIVNALIGDQLESLKDEFDITVITNLDKHEYRIPGVRYINCQFERDVHLYHDICSLIELTYILSKAPREAIINYSTPKAADGGLYHHFY